jgi:CRISPR/Cas system-associated exonuclease Cas4 (RecB family)
MQEDDPSATTATSAPAEEASQPAPTAAVQPAAASPAATVQPAAAVHPAAAPAGQLTPVQVRTLDALRRSGPPLVFDAALVDDIESEVREALEEFASRLGEGEELFVSKHRLATALDCEEFHLIPDDFAWTPSTAKGQVAHRAIQLLLSWRGEPTPTDLVDEAMARLADEERGIGAWIAGLSPGDEADLRGQSVERVTKFVESFPPLDKRANPVTEAAVRWPNEGPILLQARVDLMLGRPEGTESRKVIVDLKTGRPNLRHRQDLGFYALVETLARKVPPRKVATFYLDASEAQTEDVSERLLRSAVRRTLDGINVLVELESEGRPPVRRPGVTCRWCSLATDCDDGARYLARQHGDD